MTDWKTKLEASPAVHFNRLSKTFWVAGEQCRTVTQVVADLSPTFDREGISKRVAARRRVPQAEVLAEWDAKAAAGKARGKAVHDYLDELFRFGGGPTESPECRAASLAWSTLKATRGLVCGYTERVIASVGLRLVGRLDCLAAAADLPLIVDWKTGKYNTAGEYDRMREPFERFRRCEHVEGSLQTSLYRLILDDLGIDSALPLIVHLQPSGAFAIHETIDFREELRTWMACKS